MAYLPMWEGEPATEEGWWVGLVGGGRRVGGWSREEAYGEGVGVDPLLTTTAMEVVCSVF